MSKLSVTIPPVKKDGEEIDLTAASGGGSSFSLIKPDYYEAVLKGLKQLDPVIGKYKNIKPPKGSKGWEYVKLQPEIELLNTNRTQINRQQITVGIVHEGALYRPDEDGKSPIWPDAQYMLNALGLLVKTDSGYSLEFDAKFISSRVLRVRTSIAGYRKQVANYNPKELTELLGLADLNDVEGVQAAVEAFNIEEGLVQPDGDLTEDALKLKNVITNFYPLRPQDAEEKGYYVDWSRGDNATPAIFVTEKDYELYQWHLDNPDLEETTAF